MIFCEACYNPVKFSYSVSGNGIVNGKDYVALEHFESYENAEDFYSLASPVNKTIVWELRIINRCENCGEVKDKVLKTTNPEKVEKPKYQEKRNI